MVVQNPTTPATNRTPKKYYNYALEEYGSPIALWEIEEEWNEEDNTWELSDENIILSTDL
jgi:hypothetical protein